MPTNKIALARDVLFELVRTDATQPPKWATVDALRRLYYAAEIETEFAALCDSLLPVAAEADPATAELLVIFAVYDYIRIKQFLIPNLLARLLSDAEIRIYALTESARKHYLIAMQFGCRAALANSCGAYHEAAQLFTQAAQYARAHGFTNEVNILEYQATEAASEYALETGQDVAEVLARLEEATTLYLNNESSATEDENQHSRQVLDCLLSLVFSYFLAGQEENLLRYQVHFAHYDEGSTDTAPIVELALAVVNANNHNQQQTLNKALALRHKLQPQGAAVALILAARHEACQDLAACWLNMAIEAVADDRSNHFIAAVAQRELAKLAGARPPRILVVDPSPDTGYQKLLETTFGRERIAIAQTRAGGLKMLDAKITCLIVEPSLHVRDDEAESVVEQRFGQYWTGLDLLAQAATKAPKAMVVVMSLYPWYEVAKTCKEKSLPQPIYIARKTWEECNITYFSDTLLNLIRTPELQRKCRPPL
ncbi:MAG: hypothetical protein AAB849_01170 [Patescibacteria group bacterium]